MDGTDDYRMVTIDSLLRGSLADRGGDLVLTLDPAFQGLPDTAHGGSVLAAFDAFAGLLGPREISGAYLRRVPLATPLRLATARANNVMSYLTRDKGIDAQRVSTRTATGGDTAEVWLVPAGARAP